VVSTAFFMGIVRGGNGFFDARKLWCEQSANRVGLWTAPHRELRYVQQKAEYRETALRCTGLMLPGGLLFVGCTA